MWKCASGFVRVGRAGPEDLQLRMPEVRPLARQSVAVFGLGCVGAPTAVELARAGAGELRILDHDVVDPGTVRRWPLGFSAVGLKKVDVLRDFIRREYPHTNVIPIDRKLGAVRGPASGGASDVDVVRQMTGGASLVYDATAELGVQQFLSDFARDAGIPYLSVDGTQGGWGGRVCRVAPDAEGCWLCFLAGLEDGSIAPPPAKAAGVQPAGCGDPTFTGAGFDLAQVALLGVRVAVATLCGGAAGAYPPYPWDVTIVAFRDAAGGLVVPAYAGYMLRRHPNCPACNRR